MKQWISLSDRYPEEDRRGGLVRVSYDDHLYPRPRRVVVRRVIRPRHRPTVIQRADRPLAVLPVESLHPAAGHEGSYVAVSGSPGRGAVHVVDNVPSLGRDSLTVLNGVALRSRHGSRTALVPVVPAPVAHPAVLAPAPVIPQTPVALPAAAAPALAPRVHTGDRLPLPKCSYINTDFPGDDLIFDDDDEPGINAGSARACKARCRLEENCSFWTYKEGFSRDTRTRDCFLKEGTPGLPVPREAVPRLGFVSGTQDNNCVCIKSEDEEDEVCPIKEPRGLVYPWRSTDEDENDRERGLPPLGWTRGVYGALDPRLGPGLGLGGGGEVLRGLGRGDDVLRDTVRSLRDQLDALASRLGGRTGLDDRDLL